MTATLLDVILARDGRLGRRPWAIAMLAVAAIGVLGVTAFNADTFDESANAVPDAPTMAAFLWAALAVLTAVVLTARRLADGGRPRALSVIFGIAGATLVCGWGTGAFGKPLEPTPTAVVLWSAAIALIPPLAEAACRPSLPRPAAPRRQASQHDRARNMT